MKKKVTKTVIVCDSCGKEDYTEKCLGCRKDFCSECQEKKGVEYHQAVFFQGSGDGFYCHACDQLLWNTPLHLAFVAVKDLHDEFKHWNEDFQKRQKQAEARLSKLNPN